MAISHDTTHQQVLPANQYESFIIFACLQCYPDDLFSASSICALSLNGDFSPLPLLKIIFNSKIESKFCQNIVKLTTFKPNHQITIFSYICESVMIFFTSIIYNKISNMWLVLVRHIRFYNSELGQRNSEYFKRVKGHQKQFKLHEKTMHIKQEDINNWTANQSKKQLTQKIVRQGNYDFDVKQYVKKFNDQHKGKINLLDFSNYTTKFNDFKENPISKKDMEIIREFQKRKIDQRVQKLNNQRFGNPSLDFGAEENPLEYYKDATDNMMADDKQIEVSWSEQPKPRKLNYEPKSWFNVQDDFMMILIERNTCTKVTTLNRINYFRTLLFMGNGNGLISYGKSRDLTPEGSMTKAIIQCKKNIIAIPLDQTCTMPRKINSRFQDYHVYLRPNPGFNSWGHPVFSMMLALSGINHVGFKTIHTGKNNYTMLHSFFKAVTQNTTPQDMADLEGFKYYRHRWVRPLTENTTHRQLSY